MKIIIANKSYNIAWDFAFIVYLFGEICLAHSITGQVLMIAYVGISILYMLLKRKIKFCGFFISYILLISYGFLQCIAGLTLDNTLSSSFEVTLLINFLVMLCVYNQICLTDDIEHTLSLFELSVFLSDLYVFILSRKTLLTGRLGSSEGFNSNTLAMLSAFVVCIIINRWMLKSGKKKAPWKDVLKLLILFLVIFFSGTRKALLIIFIGIILLALMNNPRKAFRNVLIAILTIVCGFYLIMNVPTLYQMVGIRVEYLLQVFQGNNTSDSSLQLRSYFINLGMQYIRKNPIFGYGLNNFQVINKVSTYSHNNYIELLFSTGIIGLIIYYSQVLSALICNIRVRKKNRYAILMIIFIICMLIADYAMISFYERQILFVYMITWANIRREKEVHYGKI